MTTPIQTFLLFHFTYAHVQTTFQTAAVTFVIIIVIIIIIITHAHAVYSGEMFQVSVVAVGQRDGTVPSRVVSTVENTNPLDSQYWLQLANNTCTTFNYSVFSLSQSVAINLYPEGSPCSTSQDKLQIEVTLSQNCPPGFSISESAKSCVCEPRLSSTQYTNSCNITNGVGQITRH